MNELDGLEYARPDEIERRSFEIIGHELGDHGFDELEELVVKRVIHTTADFDYAKNLCFTKNAVRQGMEALVAGATVVTDTTMVAAGINKRVLGSFGGEVRTFIGDADVAAEARARGVTRSAVSMERSATLEGPLVFAIGNAPTALARLARLISCKTMPEPALVIGVPVGFVNVVESKELMRATSVESIVARGRKGGSNVAASIVNALLYLASDNRRE
ncbi:MAG: precorrin-8X methylmutase [Atopobiaceae bacterium]|nr:precorrin-8X methylmutase [Atopobiaceae bacterium]